MTGSELANRSGSAITEGIQIDQAAILRHLGLDATDPAAQALVFTCQRYGLDPILHHALLIEKRLYVTRDGLLHVAHANGNLNGIEVLEQDETDTHFVAKVAVYRKDMEHPFVYVGRFPKMRDKFEWKSNSTGKRYKEKVGEEPHPYGPEMAVKCAEAMALRRAFDVSLSSADEMWDRVEVIQEAEVLGPPSEAPDAAPTTTTATEPQASAVVDGDAPPLDGDRPCPHCGYETRPTNSSNDKAPKWRCSNEICTGSFNKRNDKYEPWVSWSANPWKPGGEAEQIIKESSPEDPVGGGGNQAATAEDAAGSAPSSRQEPATGSEPSTSDGHSLQLLDDAFDAGIVSLGQAIKASMGPCGEANLVPPQTKKGFEQLPDSVLADIVEDLKLDQRLRV